MIRLRQPNQPDLKRDNSRVQFTRSKPPVDCSGITARLAFVGTSGQSFTNDDFTTDYFTGSVYLDSAWFPGRVAVWWQTYSDTVGGALANYTVDLVDENGTVYDTQVIANNLAYRMNPLRSFVLDPATAHSYMIRMRATPGNFGDIALNNFRVYIDVQDSVRVQLQIPLLLLDGFGGGEASAADNILYSDIVEVDVQPTYGDYGGGQVPTLLLIEKAKNDGSAVSYELETIAAIQTGGGPVTLAGSNGLRNEQTGLMVTASQDSIVSTSPIRTRTTFSRSAAQFIDLNEVKAQGLYDGAGDMFVYRVVLNVYIVCPEAIQVHNSIQNDCNSDFVGTVGYEVGARFTVDSSLYEPSLLWQLDVTAGDLGGNGGVFDLLDTGAAVTGIAGVPVAGAALTGYPLWPLYDRLRSPNLVLVDGNNVMGTYDTALPPVPSLIPSGASFLIAEVAI